MMRHVRLRRHDGVGGCTDAAEGSTATASMTAENPMTAISSSGNRLVEAFLPPSRGRRRRRSARAPRRAATLSARISLAPSWSPDSSPDTIQIVSGSVSAMGSLHPGQVDSDEKQSETVGHARAFRPARARRWSLRRRRCRTGLRCAASITVRGPIVGMSTRRSCPRLAALISTPPSSRRRRPNQALPHRPHPPHHAVGAFGPFDRQDMAARDDGALADIEGGQGREKIETEARWRPGRRRRAAAHRSGCGTRRGRAQAHARRRPCGPAPRAASRRRAEPDRRPRLMTSCTSCRLRSSE